MNFPTIDGHFWIERDGKIIDPHFSNYDMICRIHNCDPKQPKSYIPAPEMTQTLMLGIFMKVLKNVFGDKPFEEQIPEFRDITKKYMGLNPRPDCCFQNSLIEVAERGGNIVFGSFGFKYKGKDGYFYEYGGEDYKTIKQFLK